MVRLDALSLMTVAMVNMLSISVSLPLIMGPRLSRPARAAQHCIQLVTLGWSLLVISEYLISSFTLSVLGMVGLTGGLLRLHHALTGWLGPRPGARWLPWLAVLMPLGYALSFDHYAVRVGWSNFLLAAMMLVLVRATLCAHRSTGRRWRLMLLACLLVMAALTAARGVLGAFFTSAYPSFLAPNPVNLVAALAVNIAVVLGTLGLMVAWREEADDHLRTMAHTDSLTGLLNRRGFTERAHSLLANALRNQTPLTLLILDLDHFKQINDQHGHEGGDKALQLFAQVLLQIKRRGDLVARLGGEEFCVMLPSGSRETACAFDERLRAELHRAAPSALGFALDYSAGMAALRRGDTELSAFMARADAALYEAKDRGRAQLRMATRSADATLM